MTVPDSGRGKRSYRCLCGSSLRGYGIPEKIIAAWCDLHIGDGHRMLTKNERARRNRDAA